MSGPPKVGQLMSVTQGAGSTFPCFSELFGITYLFSDIELKGYDGTGRLGRPGGAAARWRS